VRCIAVELGDDVQHNFGCGPCGSLTSVGSVGSVAGDDDHGVVGNIAELGLAGVFEVHVVAVLLDFGRHRNDACCRVVLTIVSLIAETRIS